MRAQASRIDHGSVPFDLFGEIPVTWPELEAWCAAVAEIAASSPRFAWYVKNWNVAEKVRAAKLAGTFEAITRRPDLLSEAASPAARRLHRAAGARFAPRP